MNRGLKVLTVAVATVGILFASSGMLLAASVVHSGMVTVRVNEKKAQGTNLYIPVPAGLIHAGIALAPLLADDELEEVRRELDEAGPALAEVLRALEDCPDAVLVDVQDGDETVQIVKRGRSFEIRVHDDQADVHVSVPAGLMSHIAQALS